METWTLEHFAYEFGSRFIYIATSCFNVSEVSSVLGEGTVPLRCFSPRVVPMQDGPPSTTPPTSCPDLQLLQYSHTSTLSLDVLAAVATSTTTTIMSSGVVVPTTPSTSVPSQANDAPMIAAGMKRPWNENPSEPEDLGNGKRVFDKSRKGKARMIIRPPHQPHK